MTNTQSPAPGVAAEATRLQFEEMAADRLKWKASVIAQCRTPAGDYHHDRDLGLMWLAWCTATQASAAAVEPAWKELGFSSDDAFQEFKRWRGIKADLEDEFKVRLTEFGLAMRNSQGERARVLQDVLVSMLQSRTPAPGMAGGVVYTADLDASNKRALEEAPRTLARLIAGQPVPQTVGIETTTSAPELLRSIANDLEIMLASATQHVSEECVTGYTVKTGALHRIIGALVGNGFRVSIPLAPHPSPAPQAAGADKLYVVMNARGSQGVVFDDKADAIWTQNESGNLVGVPTIGEAFRESYGDEALTLIEIDRAAIEAGRAGS